MDIMKRIGLSIGDTIKLLWLKQALEQPIYPRELYKLYLDQFPGRDISYDYVARIAKRLEAEGSLSMHQEHNRKYYATTQHGKEVLKRYEDLYYGQFREVYKVLKRMDYFLTKRGSKPDPPEYQLPSEYRPYLAKLISVKDATRHMIFSMGLSRSEFYVVEVIEQMEAIFGWAPSNGYVYIIVHEMEAQGALVGRWKDEHKRTVRLLKITDDGVIFAKRISNDLAYQLTNLSNYLNSLISFFE